MVSGWVFSERVRDLWRDQKQRKDPTNRNLEEGVYRPTQCYYGCSKTKTLSSTSNRSYTFRHLVPQTSRDIPSTRSVPLTLVPPSHRVPSPQERNSTGDTSPSIQNIPTNADKENNM